MAETPRLRRVGLNAVFLQPRMGGMETYARRLVPSLLELRPDLEICIFLNEAGRELLAAEPWADKVELVTHPLLGRRFTRALSETTILGHLASHRSLDLLHSLALLAPLWMTPPSVLTVADVIWLRDPDSVEPATRTLWRLLVPPAARKAERVITYSEAARREISEDLGVAQDRIDVVALGPGSEELAEPTPEGELRSRLGLGDGPIVLSVGAIKPHKNLARLIEALPRVREDAPAAVLVLPGNPTDHRAELIALAKRLEVARAIHFLGWVTDADLEGLYRAARCFVLPSVHEGFGLPVLEAMRRGVPVACSSASAVPEVAGDAALYFSPERPGEIAAAVGRLLADPELARSMAERGLEQQRLFSWRRSAEGTLASYERALDHAEP
jgi:glycosyltransferase involved in cell wall biosynthesis